MVAMKTRLAISVVIGLMAIAASGCWHKKSPQQQYTEALMRGNSMQASQVWLNMSPENRMKFARGEGIKPDDSSGKDAQQQIMNHYRDEMGEAGPRADSERSCRPSPSRRGWLKRPRRLSAGRGSPTWSIGSGRAPLEIAGAAWTFTQIASRSR